MPLLQAVMDGSVMLLMIWNGYYGRADHAIPVPAHLCEDVRINRMQTDVGLIASGTIRVECRNPEWGDYWAVRDYRVYRNAFPSYDYWGWVDAPPTKEDGWGM